MQSLNGYMYFIVCLFISPIIAIFSLRSVILFFTPLLTNLVVFFGRLLLILILFFFQGFYF